jgi:hypothetical protein
VSYVPVNRRSAEAQEQNLQAQAFACRLMHFATLLPRSGSRDPSKVVGIHVSLYLCCILNTLGNEDLIWSYTYMRNTSHKRAMGMTSIGTVHCKKMYRVARLPGEGKAPLGAEHMITHCKRSKSRLHKGACIEPEQEQQKDE